MTNSPVRIVDWLNFARRLLTREDGGLEPGHVAALLVGHILQKPRAWVLAHTTDPLTDRQKEQLDQLAARLRAGEPLPYLLEHWEFYGLDFAVSPAVLIPRPETELLVEHALQWLRRNPSHRLAADVGCGSGCIAVSLAKLCSDLHVLAVDRSAAALEVARRNAMRHAVTERVHFVQGHLLSALGGGLDLVCANLPYIPTAALDELTVAQHEPRLALDGGTDGLTAIRDLLADAPRWLSAGGQMLLEIQFDQGELAADLARLHLPDATVEVLPDLAGLPRLLVIEQNGG